MENIPQTHIFHSPRGVNAYQIEAFEFNPPDSSLCNQVVKRIINAQMDARLQLRVRLPRWRISYHRDDRGAQCSQPGEQHTIAMASKFGWILPHPALAALRRET